MKVAMLLLAAGRGSRLGAHVPKAFLRLGDDTLLAHSTARLIAALPANAECEVLVIVQPRDRSEHVPASIERVRAQLPAGAALHIVDGGATRQQSMERGLAASSPDCDLVLVHDCARALVPVGAVRQCLRVAEDVGAALLAIPATDTLKRVADDRIVETIDRRPVWYAQTPQIARRELFVRAVEHAHKTGFTATDDASLLEHAGIAVAVVPGATTNLKITRPDDLPLAAALLQQDPTPFTRP